MHAIHEAPRLRAAHDGGLFREQRGERITLVLGGAQPCHHRQYTGHRASLLMVGSSERVSSPQAFGLATSHPFIYRKS